MKAEVVIYLSALLRRWEFKGTGQLTPGTIRPSYDKGRTGGSSQFPKPLLSKSPKETNSNFHKIPPIFFERGVPKTGEGQLFWKNSQIIPFLLLLSATLTGLLCCYVCLLVAFLLYEHYS